MILLDTGYLLSLVSPRDSLYTRAKAWSQAVREAFLITEYVLWEVVNGLSMPLDPRKGRCHLPNRCSDLIWCIDQ